MNIKIIHSARHSAGRVTIRSPQWQAEFFIDNSTHTLSVDLPEGVIEADVEAFIEYLDGSGKVDKTKPSAVLKTRPRKKLPARKKP